jgi:hypothetical protein
MGTEVKNPPVHRAVLVSNGDHRHRMISPVRSGLMLVAIMAIPLGSHSQLLQTVPYSDTFKGRLVTLAGEAITTAGFAQGSQIVLVVEADSGKTMIENAFLESLQHAGFQASVRKLDVSPGTTVLRISDVHLGTGTATMSVSNHDAVPEFDARIEHEASTRYLGHFAWKGAESGALTTDSVLGKILEPLVVVSGTVLIVYLFFTIRS